MPENFYIDNGAEYLFADYVGDAIALAGRGNGRIIRAQAYNAAAKPIEAWFHRFEVDHMRHVPGWHGGKLGSPKRPGRGKLPAPFEGGFDALCAIVQGHIQAYNSIHQPYGELGQDSPFDRFEGFVERGWAATVMDPADLLTLFTKTETRIVRQHGISVDGRTWSSAELLQHFGRTVTVKVPQLGLGFNHLWVGDEHGERIGIALPDAEASPTDTRQALHSADRKHQTVSGVRSLKGDVGRNSGSAEIVDLGARRNAASLNAPAGKVSVTPDAAPTFFPKAATSASAYDQEQRRLHDEQMAAVEEMFPDRRPADAD